MTVAPGARRPDDDAPTRRRMLAAGAALGAGGLLAACGGTTDTADGAGETESSPSPTQTTASPPVGAAIIATSEVPVGAGAVVEEMKVVVTQPTEGEFKAFSAVCTHQGCTVSGVKDGIISCPCHGSAFHATDGAVANGPATRPLKEIAVAVDDGQVVRV